MFSLPLWYRHWLEIRSALPGAVLVGLLLVALGSVESLRTGPLYRNLFDNRLAQSLGAQELLAWAAVAQRLAMGAWLVAFAFAGNGLHGVNLPRHASAGYTLTLPVSRSRLIWTRYAAGCAASFLVVAGLLCGYCLAIATQGRGVPLGPIAESFAFILPVLMAWTALAGALVTVMNTFWSLLGAVPLFLLAVLPTLEIVSARPATGEVPWVPLAAMIVIAPLALLFTLHRVNEKEF